MTNGMKKTTTMSNFLWRLAERFSAQAVSTVVSIILARLLSPEDYGTIALITVFTAILQVFIDSGLGNALVQKKEADELDFSSVFYFNMALCLLLYMGMFAAAPLIASFYNDMSLVPLVRVISLTLVISGVKNIQQAYVSRHMIFKRFFFSTLGGTLASAFLGIVMAYRGYGVWALVAQQLCNASVDTIILWLTVRWRPQKMFSWQRLKGLLDYGWKLLASSLLGTAYNNLCNLIIGKMYSSETLAYYNQGDKLPQLVVNNINTSIDSVLLPAMSNVQDDPKRVRSMTRRAIKTSVYLMAPLMMGLAFCAETIVELILTEKWLPCVPYLRIFCITYMFWPVHTANLNAIKAMGRSDIFLKLEIIKKIMGLILLLIAMRISVLAMAYSMIISSILSQIINSWPNRELLHYSYLDQWRDILPSILLALGMGIVIYPLKLFSWDPVLICGAQIVLGMLFYLVGSILLRFEPYMYIKDGIKRKLVG